MDIQDLLDAKDQKKLEQQYGQKYKAIRGRVMHDCSIKFNGQWRIHRVNLVDALLPNNEITRFIPQPDYKKGFYSPGTNTISISDWSLQNSSNGEIFRVVIHEILHSNGYDHGTKMTAKENTLWNQFLAKNGGRIPFIF